LEIPKNDNLKIALPEDLFDMTNGHDLCRACAQKPKFFWQSEHQCFQKNQRSRSCATKPTVKICVKLPVSTYLPTNPTKFLIFNYLIIYFSLSLSSSPHEIFVNESNGQDLSAAPATYQLSRSLSLSL
jgi:hypothetical protein